MSDIFDLSTVAALANPIDNSIQQS